MRIAPGPQRLADIATSNGQTQLDALMRNVGRGALDSWLRLLMREITRQEDGNKKKKENLRLDITKDEFTTA
jgi:hypothetical protein